MGMRSPCMRNIGGTPTAKCRSEQPWATPNLRNASILAITCKATRKQLDFRAFRPESNHKREVRQPRVSCSVNNGLAGTGPLEEFFERQAQLVHALCALGLVQRHA